jgi:hypothetical protein
MKVRLPRIPKALAPDGRDIHSYVGLALVAWGLWSSPLPWLAPVVVGIVLAYMGIFMFAPKRGE